MPSNTFKHRRDGMPAIWVCEAHTFGQERYDALLRDAEQYRLVCRVSQPPLTTKGQRTLQIIESPITRVLVWAKILRVNPAGAS